MGQKTGTAATVSIISTAGSYFATFTGHPIWGLILSLVAVPMGILGLLFAASPKIGGGILSIAAIVFGALAFGLAVLGIAGLIIF